MGTTAVYNIISQKNVTRFYSKTAGDYTSPLSILHYIEEHPDRTPEKILSRCYTNPKFPGEIILTPSEGGLPVFREIGQNDKPSAAAWITIDFDRGALEFVYDNRHFEQKTEGFTVRIEDAVSVFDSNLFDSCENQDYNGYIEIMNPKLENLLRGLSVNNGLEHFTKEIAMIPNAADSPIPLQSKPDPGRFAQVKQKRSGLAGKKATMYIAYGSNLNLKQMTYRCPTAKVADTAQLQGYEMLFRGGSVRGGRGAVATVEPKEDASVPVLLWNIREKDEQALDRYEGFPHFYHKEQMSVNLNGRDLSAMVYVMNPGFELGVPSDEYYETIAQGYERAGFDLHVLAEAVEESYKRSLSGSIEQEDDQQSLFDDEIGYFSPDEDTDEQQNPADNRQLMHL